MTIEDITVREYLRATEGSFWDWRDQAEVVTWKDGKTILFRGEAADVLRALAPDGLPPFSALLLVIAATRHNWASDGSEAGILAAILRGEGDEAKRLALLSDVLAQLDRLHAIDSDLRTPIAAKIALAQIVFENGHAVVPLSQGPAIADAMRDGLDELLDPPDVEVATKGYAPALLLRDLHLLHVGLRRVDAEAIRLRMATGFTSLPAPANIELPAFTTAANLIKSLAEESELGGLGRLARRLLPAATLPRRLSAEREQELGGYSDIANRGSLERMLTSELAYDNLTLAVRVAMNEALYLRRESPPSKPQQHRTVLIDAGIRSWGVPRVFATAAALALAATLPARGSIKYYRARGGRLEPVDLLKRAGVVQHLEALEPDLHIADALPAFIAELENATDAIEPVLVTTEEGLADPAVQTALRKSSLSQLFIATVNRQGRFRMYERRAHGSKLLHEATLDLNDLVPDAPQLVVSAKSTDLPAIFGVHPFPLYLSHNIHADRAWYVDGWGVLSITNDRRLLQWNGGRRRGGRQITDRLPPGKVWWASPAASGDGIGLVIGSSEKLQFVRVRSRGLVHCTPLLAGPASHVCEHRGKLLVFGRDEAWIVSPQTGGVIESATPPDFWRREGRFYVSTAGVWFALTFDGQSARFEAVPQLGTRRPKIIACFDQVGTDGPIAVEEFGFLNSTATGITTNVHHGLKPPVRVLWISPDGRRLKLTHSTPVGNPGVVMVDTTTGACTPCGASTLDDRIQAAASPAPVWHRFIAIGVTAHNNLALQSQRGRWLTFDVQNGLPVFTPERSKAAIHRIQKFEPLESDFGYKLSVARWPDGSRCVLDSRGLLHLRAADRHIPEATIVLAEGEVSGWCSDGRLWGKSYYVGEGSRVLSSARAQLDIFYTTVQRFTYLINGNIPATPDATH